MMTRDTLVRIVIPIALYVAFGWWIGGKLASYPGLVEYKFFNACGGVMSILGAVVLSQLVVDNPRYKEFVLKYVAEQFLSFLSFAGAALMLYAMHWATGPSASVVKGLGVNFFFFIVGPSMLFMNITVHGVERPVPWTDKTRYTAFGGYLAGGGMSLQLYASIKDMWG